MDDQYIPSFIKRLDSICSLSVGALEQDQIVQGNKVYICSSICRLKKKGHLIIGGDKCGVFDYNPCIDEFFFSVASLAKDKKVLSVVLTGIGADGAKGMYEIVKNGGKALVEDSSSAIVYGMPMRAKELTPQATQCALDEIIEKILEFND